MNTRKSSQGYLRFMWEKKW